MLPSHLQVAVAAAGATPAFVQVAPGRAVEEVTVVVAATVLVQDVPHLRLEERHVHVDRHHLQETQPRLAQVHTDSFYYCLNCKNNNFQDKVLILGGCMEFGTFHLNTFKDFKVYLLFKMLICPFTLI